MLLVTLVLFGQDPFEPMILFVSDQPIRGRGMVCDDELLSAFRSLAACVRTFAAALDAFIAIVFRCLALKALALAWPPCLASSDRTFLINSSSMWQMLHHASKMSDLFSPTYLTPCWQGEIIRTLKRAERVL